MSLRDSNSHLQNVFSVYVLSHFILSNARVFLSFVRLRTADSRTDSCHFNLGFSGRHFRSGKRDTTEKLRFSFESLSREGMAAIIILFIKKVMHCFPPFEKMYLCEQMSCLCMCVCVLRLV